MRVIAIANQKGGVGKTTVTRELSAACAIRGYRTLVIDCDPQANLTGSWVSQDIYEYTLSYVLIEPDKVNGAQAEPLPLSDAIVETPVNNLDLIPADIRLARFEQQPDYLMFRLRNELTVLENEYDLVFLDCAPQLGKLLTVALYAAHSIIIPCSSDAMGLTGLSDLVYTINQIRKNVNNKLEILGAVMNLYKPQRNLSAEAGMRSKPLSGRLILFLIPIFMTIQKLPKPSQRLPGHHLCRESQSIRSNSQSDR